MLRCVRYGTCCLCLAICVLFAALWVRSYLFHESLRGEIYGGKATCLMESWKGQLTLLWHSSDPPPLEHQWRWFALPADRFEEILGNIATLAGPPRPRASFRFSTKVNPPGGLIALPHWLPVLLAAAATTAFKPKPRMRVSLREMFVVATIAAAVLGMIAALAHTPK